jgi:hypothetical protein
VVVRLFESKNLTPLAAVALDGDARASVRIEGQRVTIADARGRLIGLDLALGRVTHDLRL